MAARNIVAIEIENPAADAATPKDNTASVLKKASVASLVGMLIFAAIVVVAGLVVVLEKGTSRVLNTPAVVLKDVKVAPPTSFDKVMQALGKETFDDGKLAVLSAATDADAFETTEIAAFIGKLTFSSNYLKGLKSFTDLNMCTNTSSVIDPSNMAPILAKFAGSPDKSTATAYLAAAVPGTRSPALTDDQIAQLLSFAAGSARNDTSFQALVAAVQKESFKKVKVVSDEIARNPGQFTPDQLRSLLALFSFSSDRLALADLLEKFVTGLTCKQVIGILSTLPFSDEKLKFLDVLKANIVDAQNKMDVINSFTFQTEKSQAAVILKAVCGRRPPPNNPVFGVVTGNPVVLIVDKSGSMTTSFSIGSSSYTRDSFCYNELTQVLQGLPAYNKFNVILFSSSAKLLFPDAVPATPANVQQAIQLSAGNVGGSTNSLAALQLAYGMPTSPEAIYFLSDGEPDQATSTILSAIDGLDKGRKIPVNAIAFTLPSRDAKAQDFMRALAAKTGGFFRSVESAAVAKLSAGEAII